MAPAGAACLRSVSETRRLIPVALLSAGLLAFGLQPAPRRRLLRTLPARRRQARRRPPDPRRGRGSQRAALSPRRPAWTAGNGAKVLTGARVEDGDVLVDVYVDGSLADADVALRGLGMRVTATNAEAPQRRGGRLAARRPSCSTRPRSAAPRRSRPCAPATDAADGTDAGSVLSQGDAAHHGPQARALGATGAGVKVGVISDSHQPGRRRRGRQPGLGQPARPGVHVLLDDPGRHDRRGPGDGRDHLRRGAGHHRHATSRPAPSAPPARRPASTTWSPRASRSSPTTSSTSTSRCSRTARSPRRSTPPRRPASTTSPRPATGPSRAGRARYSAGADNDFDPGAGVDTVQTIGTFSNASPFVSLQWAEPWGGATTNLRSTGTSTACWSRSADDEQHHHRHPQRVRADRPPAGPHTVGIGIRRVSRHRHAADEVHRGRHARVHDRRVHRPTPTRSTPTPPRRPARWPSPPSNWSTPTTPEAFSSRGPSITRLSTRPGSRSASGGAGQAGARGGRRRVARPCRA